jgi:PAS domain-containing protein
VETLRARGGKLLNEEVIWKTKNGKSVHVLLSYVQVAYHAGRVSFGGSKRLSWVYDVTALKEREVHIAEQEHQFREILEFLPAGLNVVDNDGRVLFHNAFSGSLSEPAARRAR